MVLFLKKNIFGLMKKKCLIKVETFFSVIHDKRKSLFGMTRRVINVIFEWTNPLKRAFVIYLQPVHTDEEKIEYMTYLQWSHWKTPQAKKQATPSAKPWGQNLWALKILCSGRTDVCLPAPHTHYKYMLMLM